MVGPWWHMPWSRYLGATDFAPDAEHLVDELQVRFFRRYLMGDASALADQPPVRLFVLGRDRWRGDDAWPPGARELVLHLRSDGQANSLAGDGSLTEAPPQTGEPADVPVSDPSVPVMSLGGRGCCLAGASPMGRPTSGPRRSGATSSSTTPRCWTRSSWSGCRMSCSTSRRTRRRSTWLSGWSTSTPDGRAINVTDGQVRVPPGATRAGDTAAIEVAMAPVAAAFLPAHRVRLEVAWSSFPMYNRNPHSGVEPTAATARDFRVATQVLFHDSSRPSRLVLPVPPS